jgi:hypothetical protein
MRTFSELRPGGRERGVEPRGVADVDRGVGAQAAVVGDVREVLFVPGRDVDRVVRQVDLAADAEVEHERAARVPLRVDPAVGPRRPQAFGDEVPERPRGVGVDDDVFVLLELVPLGRADPHAADAAAGELDRADRA